MVLWPKGTYQGHETPPSITLEEGRRKGEEWTNKRISLTLDKAPNILLDLQVAYARALDLLTEEAPSEAEVATREFAKPTDPVGYLKTSILESIARNKVYSRQELVELAKGKHDWAETIEVEQAISRLLDEKAITPKFEKLTLVGFRKT